MREGKVFVDMNIIIYACTVSSEERHKIAVKIIEDLWQFGLGVISTQVLQEFFYRITNKIRKPLDVKIAKEIVSDLLTWDVVVNDGESLLKAIDIHKRYRYSFWDAMVIQAALKGNASLLLSEDLSDNQIIDGVRIKNPFVK